MRLDIICRVHTTYMNIRIYIRTIYPHLLLFFSILIQFKINRIYEQFFSPFDLSILRHMPQQHSLLDLWIEQISFYLTLCNCDKLDQHPTKASMNDSFHFLNWQIIFQLLFM